MTDTEQIFHAIQTLPVRERLRLVERVVHHLADSSEAELRARPHAEASSLLGLFADEPELIDEVCRFALDARKRDPLRPGTGSDESAP